MAKYIMIHDLNMFTYALDECEDYLVIDGYIQIIDSGRFSGEKHLKVFEYYHMQDGGTLNDNILLRINGYLRRLGIEPLAFVNGHTTNYAGLRGFDKVHRRQGILDQLRALPHEMRADLVARKKIEASLLPERNHDYPTRAPVLQGQLSRDEQERRRMAVANAQRAEARRSAPPANTHVPTQTPRTNDANPEGTNDADREFVPESTMQDNMVELLTEMQDLRTEVASLKAMLQTIFRNV